MTFWITYSALHLGATRAARDILFQVVSSTNESGKEWRKRDSIESKIWNAEYDMLFDEYKAKFTRYANMWLDSPAGNQFKQEVEKKRFDSLRFVSDCRQQKVRVPSHLEPKDLICWSYLPTPKSEPVKLDGIPWTYKEIFDIFSILSQVCEAGYLDENDRDQGRWFNYDRDSIKATRLRAAKSNSKPYGLLQI